MAKRWRLRAPASSANLGPGFDALGIALDCNLTCEFAEAPAINIAVSGRDADLIPNSPENLIWSTANRIAREQGRELPPLVLHAHNEIPLGKGLGSSAAALTSGVVIAGTVLGLGWDKQRVFAEAARLEGHPDNVAACVFGSAVASAMSDEGQAWAIRLAVPRDWEASIVAPDFPIPTSKSRSVLPESYSRQDVTFNLQRSALLVAALASGSAEVFPEALADRLHQPYRAALVPGLPEILALRGDGLLGCCLSGAGPSVLVLHKSTAPGWPERVAEIFAEHGQRSEIHRTKIQTDGYTLAELP